MDLYIVKPNLEILNCENSPTEETLISKKSNYLQLQKKCKHLAELNGGENISPPWCKGNDGGVVIGGEGSPSSTGTGKAQDKIEASGSGESNDSNESDTNHGHTHTRHHNRSVVLPLQSVALAPEDYTKLHPDTDSISLSKLNIPTHLSLVDGKWLALKYMQLSSDVALLRYKYMKSYAKINRLVQKYFSKPQVSQDDETKGFKEINEEMGKFKIYENILSILVKLKKQFKEKFAGFNLPSTCDASPSSSDTHKSHSPSSIR